MALHEGTDMRCCTRNVHYRPSWSFCLIVQDRQNEAVNVLSKIFDFARLEDEVEFLRIQSEEDHEKTKEIKYWDVFKHKQIRLAFIAGAGLQVINYELVKVLK